MGDANTITQLLRNRPDFFEQGQQQLEEDIRQLQKPSTQNSPLLTIEENSQKWQPLLIKAGGFSIWAPVGVLSQEVKTFSLPQGTLNFQVLAIQSGPSRFVAAFSQSLTPSELQEPDILLTRVGDAIKKDSPFQVKRDTTFSLNGYPGRELTLNQGNETIILRLSLINQRLYVLGVSQSGSVTLSPAAITFFNSFHLLK
ncbi:MAG: hypothetical protein ACRCT1_19725 [Microcoleaceae cyanobacterium]